MTYFSGSFVVLFLPVPFFLVFEAPFYDWVVFEGFTEVSGPDEKTGSGVVISGKEVSVWDGLVSGESVCGGSGSAGVSGWGASVSGGADVAGSVADSVTGSVAGSAAGVGVACVSDCIAGVISAAMAFVVMDIAAIMIAPARIVPLICLFLMVMFGLLPFLLS